MRQSLFAYGSFSENQVHYSKFSQMIVNSEPSSVYGQVYRLRCGYPILSVEGSDQVPGHLFELEVPESFWSVMDQLLGVSGEQESLWIRQTVSVDCANDGVLAQAYVLNPEMQSQVLRPIPQGRWSEDMTQAPPLTQHLETRHLDYLKKLSQARGRELVPYKLDVYRTLMSLELIKDKGRRPALTRLGQEISQFLH
jgi:gamma-glutamylcyclotransferase (GGCT)/AIG2-like uncharacterized protein YtfP